ncbi:hypothetical protein ALO95_101836 [Pseudomonas syringae pv. antirrhini]|uniref:Uncharacterized protein n=3 Tax=Pseudomonas syringae group genomosp. 3 TaxID=251701 RepID=A0A3M4TMV3_9PSED|nr:Uncharacterized protein ALO88_04890 [Pseudomonas syringae pv. antirrhini]PYD03939.1 hypothetical protein DND90_05200 [Pseudomonas syringae pv. maculicola]RMM06550.1 hypothetical protein ALQ85_102035 [Pseudomonas syringae]RMR28501.1 hypothetical protein ALP87_102162 [Pseudomonas syringae pv. coriandricola]RMM73195.1 hypothetical protein ALQ72_100581 [Pseudomonas syringae pv. maculicola]
MPTCAGRFNLRWHAFGDTLRHTSVAAPGSILDRDNRNGH